MNPIETHEKNLAWIDAEIESVLNQFISDEGYTNSLTANRKTLERHRPSRNFPRGFMCEECSRNKYIEDIEDFPCPTRTEVLDGLGIPK